MRVVKKITWKLGSNSKTKALEIWVTGDFRLWGTESKTPT